MATYVATATQYLLDKLKQDYPTLYNAVMSGQKEIVSAELYHTVKLPSLIGPQELLKPNNKFEEGISSFDGNKLPKDEHFAYAEIAVMYGKTGDGTGVAPSPDTIEYSNLILDARKNTIVNATAGATPNTAPDVRIPVAFQNSGILVKVGNGKVYEANIASHLVNNTQVDDSTKQFVRVVTPKIMRAETPIAIDFRGVGAGTVPAAHNYIKVVFRGVIVRDKV